MRHGIAGGLGRRGGSGVNSEGRSDGAWGQQTTVTRAAESATVMSMYSPEVCVLSIGYGVRLAVRWMARWMVISSVVEVRARSGRVVFRGRAGRQTDGQLHRRGL